MPDKIKPIDRSDEPHYVWHPVCTGCGHDWVAVAHHRLKPAALECPNCRQAHHKILREIPSCRHDGCPKPIIDILPIRLGDVQAIALNHGPEAMGTGKIIGTYETCDAGHEWFAMLTKEQFDAQPDA